VNGNVQAMLAVIRHTEGTYLIADPYRATFRGEDKPMHIIADLSDHPALTGEWLGESIAFLGPEYAGEVSTAAGAYMIRKRTWLDLRAAHPGRLPDFSPASQDLACELLIGDAGALGAVLAGDLVTAIAKLAPIWASLPGSLSGQPQACFAAVQTAYTAAGGQLLQLRV
jgi:lysozyme